MESKEEKPKKDRKVLKAVLLTILIIFLSLGLLYFTITQIQDSYQNGVYQGVQFFYNQIVNDVARCIPYPIKIKNETEYLTLVGCPSQNAEIAKGDLE